MLKNVSRKKKQVIVFIVIGIILVALYTIFGLKYENNVKKQKVLNADNIPVMVPDSAKYLSVLYDNEFGIDSVEIAEAIGLSRLVNYPMDRISLEKLDDLLPAVIEEADNGYYYHDMKVVKGNQLIRFYVIWLHGAPEFEGVIPISVEYINEVLD